MKKIILIVAISILLFGLVGCVAEPSSQATTNRVNLGIGLTRFVDDEAGVVCWMASYGISCLPMKDTLLP